MSKFNFGDKVYLEGKVEETAWDNTYQLRYKDRLGDEHLTDFVRDDVLHPTDELYNKGLNDAWELARKISAPFSQGGYTVDELKNIFGENVVYRSVYVNFTPQEALAKVKEYEERNEIKVGDVVRLKGCLLEGIVTRVTKTNICRLFKDGSCDSLSAKEDFEKTGERFDSIDEFMRSEE